jgi:hypothetical protein
MSNVGNHVQIVNGVPAYWSWLNGEWVEMRLGVGIEDPRPRTWGSRLRVVRMPNVAAWRHRWCLATRSWLVSYPYCGWMWRPYLGKSPGVSFAIGWGPLQATHYADPVFP